MAESVVIVCDVCGNTPAETVAIRLKDRNLAKDLCATHVAELVKGARAPKRGRPAGTIRRRPAVGRARSSGRGTSRPASRKASAPKKSTASRKSTARKKPTASKPARRRITNPATLEKRRAALKKAREALAAKRAAAKKAV